MIHHKYSKGDVFRDKQNTYWIIAAPTANISEETYYIRRVNEDHMIVACVEWIDDIYEKVDPYQVITSI